MKGVIVEMDMYYKIRSYYNDGKSIRWIARTLGISRQTVKKYCSGDTIPGIRKEYHRDNTIVTDDVEQFILWDFIVPLSLKLSKNTLFSIHFSMRYGIFPSVPEVKCIICVSRNNFRDTR